MYSVDGEVHLRKLIYIISKRSWVVQPCDCVARIWNNVTSQVYQAQASRSHGCNDQQSNLGTAKTLFPAWPLHLGVSLLMTSHHKLVRKQFLSSACHNHLQNTLLNSATVFLMLWNFASSKLDIWWRIYILLHIDHSMVFQVALHHDITSYDPHDDVIPD